MRARLRSESGFTLVELLIVMVILGIVLGALTTIFVSGSNAELDLNRRYQSQQQARLALDRIRADIHCASAAQAQTIGAYPGLKLTIGNTTGVGNCASAATVSWCLVPSAAPSRFALYRSTSTSSICSPSDTARVRVADYIVTTANALTTAATIAQNAQQSVGVDFRVSVHPTSTQDVYELSDTIVARNAGRCVTGGGCTAPTVS